jgi:hypothetical protein
MQINVMGFGVKNIFVGWKKFLLRGKHLKKSENLFQDN